MKLEEKELELGEEQLEQTTGGKKLAHIDHDQRPTRPKKFFWNRDDVTQIG